MNTTTQTTPTTPTTSPTSCPRFDHCIAPICPLDPHWSSSAHLSGERVCTYLLASVKPGGVATIPAEIAETVVQLGPKIAERFGAIGSRMETAKTSPVRGANLRKLREAQRPA